MGTHKLVRSCIRGGAKKQEKSLSHRIDMWELEKWTRVQALTSERSFLFSLLSRQLDLSKLSHALIINDSYWGKKITTVCALCHVKLFLKQSSLNVLEPQGQYFCFLLYTNSIGFELKSWWWDDGSEFQHPFTSRCVKRFRTEQLLF